MFVVVPRVSLGRSWTLGQLISFQLFSQEMACRRALSYSPFLNRTSIMQRRRGYPGIAVKSFTFNRPLRISQSRLSSSAAPEQDFGGSSQTEQVYTAVDQDAEDEFQIKMKILGAALNHVNLRGWSTDALRAGAEDLNLSESVASLCTPYDLVEYFQRLSNSRLESHLKGMDSKDKNLYSSMEYRLRLVIPVIDRYHQAMGLSLEPVNVPRSLNVLRELSDIICINGLGDKSTDLRWYTKRSGIVSLYVATECCMVQDKSDDFKDTWSFLERRVKDYEFFEKAGSMAYPMMETGFTTLLNILGMNRKR